MWDSEDSENRAYCNNMFVFLMLSSDINVKTWPLPRTVGLVCAGGGGSPAGEWLTLLLFIKFWGA